MTGRTERLTFSLILTKERVARVYITTIKAAKTKTSTSRLSQRLKFERDKTFRRFHLADCRGQTANQEERKREDGKRGDAKIQNDETTREIWREPSWLMGGVCGQSGKQQWISVLMAHKGQRGMQRTPNLNFLSFLVLETLSLGVRACLLKFWLASRSLSINASGHGTGWRHKKFGDSSSRKSRRRGKSEEWTFEEREVREHGSVGVCVQVNWVVGLVRVRVRASAFQPSTHPAMEVYSRFKYPFNLKPKWGLKWCFKEIDWKMKRSRMKATKRVRFNEVGLFFVDP